MSSIRSLVDLPTVFSRRVSLVLALCLAVGACSKPKPRVTRVEEISPEQALAMTAKGAAAPPSTAPPPPEPPAPRAAAVVANAAAGQETEWQKYASDGKALEETESHLQDGHTAAAIPSRPPVGDEAGSQAADATPRPDDLMVDTSALSSRFRESIARDESARRSAFAAQPGAGGRATPANLLDLRLTAISARIKDLAKARQTEQNAERSGWAMQVDARKIAAALDPVIRRIEASATVSLHVRDLQSQMMLYDHGGDTLRNPASNQKMLTTCAALDLLGPEYRFETSVLREGTALYLVGQGDPSLTPDALSKFARELVGQVDLSDITEVVADDTVFSADRFIPGIALDDIGVAYAAPTGALSLNNNSVSVVVRPSSTGQAAVVDVVPSSPHVTVASQARTVSEGETGLTIRSRPDGERTVIEVRGQIVRGQAPVVERRRISEPTRFTVGFFAAEMSKLVKKELAWRVAAAPPTARLLRAWTSVALIDILQEAMAFSNNFAVEQVLRTTAWRMTGEPGSFDNGKKMLEAYWKTIGLTPDGLVVDNGSGLTREGRFTSRGLVDLLSAAYMTQFPNSGLMAVLPVAGRPGTLAKRHLEARGRLRAKTGTLDGVSALSGVLTNTKDEPVIVFSLMLNPSSTTSMAVGMRHDAEEKIVGALLKYIDARRIPHRSGRR